MASFIKPQDHFNVFERGSCREGWATDREDERGRKIQMDGQKLPSPSLSLVVSSSSPAV